MSALNFPSKFPILESDRCILRCMKASDALALFANYSDEDIAKNFLDEPLKEIQQAEQFIEAFQEEFSQGKAITWAITFKETHQMIGTCSLMIREGASAEIGYDLAKAHWGQGLMTEALEAMLGYGFDELGLEMIKADTMSANARSINLLKRLQFQLDDVRDNYHWFSIHNKINLNRG